jgi:molecular chaperone GrpE (heat shock protein)
VQRVPESGVNGEMTDMAEKEHIDEIKHPSIEELINRWHDDHIKKLRELQKLRYESRKFQAEFNEEMNAFLNALVNTLDEYDKMLANVRKALSDEDRKAKRVLKNFMSIRRKFSATTKQFGLTPIESSEGEFISGLHKAVGVENNPDVPQGHIIRVERQGYYWKNSILRPTEVIVSATEENFKEPGDA